MAKQSKTAVAAAELAKLLGVNGTAVNASGTLRVGDAALARLAELAPGYADYVGVRVYKNSVTIDPTAFPYVAATAMRDALVAAAPKAPAAAKTTVKAFPSTKRTAPAPRQTVSIDHGAREVGVGDMISFKSDIEQEGVVVEIRRNRNYFESRTVLVVKPANGSHFYGDYIGPRSTGDSTYEVELDECW